MHIWANQPGEEKVTVAGNCFFPRHGAELTDRLPRMIEALTKLPDPIDPRVILDDLKRKLSHFG